MKGRARATSYPFHLRKPVEGKDIFIKDIQYRNQQYLSYAAWESERHLRLAIVYLETPYVVTYDLLFCDNALEFSFHMNSSINLKDFTAASIKLA